MPVIDKIALTAGLSLIISIILMALSDGYDNNPYINPVVMSIRKIVFYVSGGMLGLSMGVIFGCMFLAIWS